jgi:hypothetical protein
MAVRQDQSRSLVDKFFTWLSAQADRVSRKSELGKALAYMLRRQDGFCLFLEDGHVDMDSNLVENAIRSPAMTRRNTLFAGHDDGARSWARFASLIGTCRMNGVEPYAYLHDLYTKLANGHLEKDIDALMPWAYAATNTPQMSSPGTPRRAQKRANPKPVNPRASPKINGTEAAHTKQRASPNPMGRSRRLRSMHQRHKHLSTVNGRVKVSQRAAQNVATLGLG